MCGLRAWMAKGGRLDGYTVLRLSFWQLGRLFHESREFGAVRVPRGTVRA